MDSLLNRNLDVTLLVGGPGHHYGLRHRDLNELRNHLALNALLGSCAILSRESTKTRRRESGVSTSEASLKSRGSRKCVWCGGHSLSTNESP